MPSSPPPLPLEFSALDVGCGFGDLLPYLEGTDYKITKYTGIDFICDFITEARKRHAGTCINTEFIVGSTYGGGIAKHDIVVASGIFNKRCNGWYKYTEDLIKTMFDLCTHCVCANFLSIYSDNKQKNAYYADPNKILNLAFKIGKRVVLKHDYRKNDFTVRIYK